MKLKKQIVTAVVAASATVLAASQSAYAALPAEVSTQMTAAKTDAVELATMGLLIIIAIAAIKYLRRGV